MFRVDSFPGSGVFEYNTLMKPDMVVPKHAPYQVA